MDNISDEDLRRFVRNFLKEFRILVEQHGLIANDQNEKNRKGLIELGLTSKQRVEEILSLSVTNFCSGPHDDKLHPGHYWVFGKQIDGVEVYIKLKIAGSSGNEHAVCYSFHRAEWPLSYPLTD